jgi:iron complex transport system substrate-binding protein
MLNIREHIRQKVQIVMTRLIIAMKVNVKTLRVVKLGVAIHLFVSLVTVGFCFVACAANARVVVDSAGRRVEVPAKIERVFAAGAPAGVFVYTLAPEKLLNWNLPLTPKQRAYMPTRYAELPALGRLTGRGNTASVETVLATRPDVILDYGTINPNYISLADRVQKQTGVPYLLFDGAFNQIANIYKSAGAALGAGERAGQLSRYADQLLSDVDKRLARVPAEKRPLVYYARGSRGLQTGLKGSINVESIERIGARNVAAEWIGQGSLASVSPEQLLAWDPEIVITAEAPFCGNRSQRRCLEKH